MAEQDETIAIYSASSFSPELAAKIFFSEHSESEVTNKLHELANLQGQIELILRHKVRENYSLFMYANREISRVGVDMNDLKHLVEDTKKILQEVRAATQPNNEMRYSRAIDKKLLPSLQQQMAKASPVNNFSETIPAWVRQAPQEIDRLIIEQQYHQAVSFIKRTLAFLESIKDLGVENLDPLSSDREMGIGAQVQKRSLHLAEILRDSLVRLPNSELWGISEKTKRLQLLVKLGHKDIAAQGFSTGQKDIIRKALRYVEASGDVEKFTSELSRVFFTHLREACTNFMELFSTNSGTSSSATTSTTTGSGAAVAGSSAGEAEESDMASLSYLVGWIQEQMSVFVTALARQIQLGAAEYRSKVFEQNVHTLRNYHQQRQQNLLAAKASRSRPGSTRMSRTPYEPFDSPDKLSAASLTPERTLVRSSSASAAKWSRSSLGTSGYNTVRGRLASMSARDLAALVPVSTDGPLTFTSRCLQVAYKEAMALDLLGLQAGASLSWHIIPEIKSILNSFTDDIIREMENEVSNDDWTPIRCPQPEVRFPGKASAPSRRELESNQEDSRSLKKASSTITSLFGGVTFENEDDDIEISESNVSGVEIYTSSSYDWIVAIMTYFIGEVLCLLQVDTTSTSTEEMATSRFSRRSMSSDFCDYRNLREVPCSRIDLCELDPEIAACLLRIVVRYVRAMMSVKSRSLTYECSECFHKTVEEISVSLLPSVEDVITKGFFSDGSTLVVNPPKVVFASLRKAIDTLQREE